MGDKTLSQKLLLSGAIGLALVGMGKLNTTVTKNIRTEHAMFAYILGNADHMLSLTSVRHVLIAETYINFLISHVVIRNTLGFNHIWD